MRNEQEKWAHFFCAARAIYSVGHLYLISCKFSSFGLSISFGPIVHFMILFCILEPHPPQLKGREMNFEFRQIKSLRGLVMTCRTSVQTPIMPLQLVSPSRLSGSFEGL